MCAHLTAGERAVAFQSDDPEIQNLKSQYLDCLGALQINLPNLRQIIRRLLAVPVPWKQLVKWAAQAGYRDKYLRKILSEILVDSGIGRRNPGAGRATPPEALAILASVCQQHGDVRAEKLLLAAYRASKSQRSTQRQQERAIFRILPVARAPESPNGPLSRNADCQSDCQSAVSPTASRPAPLAFHVPLISLADPNH